MTRASEPTTAIARSSETMPYINLQITEGATRAQKAQIVAEFTATLVRVLQKRPDQTHIVIQDIKEADWGVAGMLTGEYRAREREQSQHDSAQPRHTS